MNAQNYIRRVRRCSECVLTFHEQPQPAVVSRCDYAQRQLWQSNTRCGHCNRPAIVEGCRLWSSCWPRGLFARSRCRSVARVRQFILLVSTRLSTHQSAQFSFHLGPQRLTASMCSRTPTWWSERIACQTSRWWSASIEMKLRTSFATFTRTCLLGSTRCSAWFRLVGTTLFKYCLAILSRQTSRPFNRWFHFSTITWPSVPHRW